MITVGSESSVKRSGVEAAFPGVKVECVEVVSVVAEQPVGEMETLRGALHRAKTARERVPAAWLAIGIESGMVQLAGKWVDRACIVVIGSNERSLTLWSESLEIPPSNAATALQQHTTWSPYKDPHLLLCGRSRSNFISATLS